MSTENKKPQVPNETFKTSEGVIYRFVTGKFILNGEEVLASDALQNDEILAELVDVKSGVIEVVG